MDISLMKVFSNNYTSRFWLILSILSPIFGVCVLLSVYGILPKFPLTENMSDMTAILIMLTCIGITLIGIFTIRSIIAKLRNIITNGTLISATILDTIATKYQVSIKYEFTYNDEMCKDQHNIAKKLGYRKDYLKGKEIKIYALKNSDGKILTAPSIY